MQRRNCARMIRIFRAMALLFAFAICAGQAAAAGLIQAGPMVGHVGEDSARVWLRVEAGASIKAEASQGEKSFAASKVEDLGEGFFLAHFDGLAPATNTESAISVEKSGAEAAKEKVSFRTAPRAADTGKVRFAFGSCSKFPQYPTGPIYHAIADEAPDFALFVGDNSYFIVGNGEFGTSGEKGDWTSPELMIARHLETRTHPDLQRMLRSIPCYGIWDDHDYGPNNADRTFARKEDALRIFKQMWANPSYGDGETKGIFGSFRHGPVEVFLMDDRYHKYVHAEHSEIGVEDGEIWGDAQLKWLMRGLKASTAPVKLIANGTQVITETEKGEGHFQEARKERQKLFDFIRENKIGGVVFLSGDRHYTEAMRLRTPDGPEIYEFTSSPLQQGQEVKPLEVKNPTQLWGMRGNSYGLVTVDIPEAGKGTIRFEARDEKNHVPILNAARCVTTVELRRLNY